jgi:hypothetical protein
MTGVQETAREKGRQKQRSRERERERGKKNPPKSRQKIPTQTKHIAPPPKYPEGPISLSGIVQKPQTNSFHLMAMQLLISICRHFLKFLTIIQFGAM